MKSIVYICASCDRFAAQEQGSPCAGERFARSVEAHVTATGADLFVRRVDCLNGCLGPVNACLIARGKPTYRITNLGLEDTSALILVAAAFRTASTGKIDAELVNHGFEHRHSVVFRS